MTQTHQGYAATSIQSSQPPKMEVTREDRAISQDAEAQTIASTGASQQKRKKQSLDYVLRTGLAGGLAGCVAKTMVGPLDRVKILFQASNPQFAKYSGSWFGVVTAMREINQQSGLRGLFRGHSATLLRIFPYAAIKFLAYEQIRAVIITNPSQETPFRRLVSGSLAGMTSVFFVYPLDVIRVRLAFETRLDSRASLKDICSQIYHEQPIRTSASASSLPPLPSAVANPLTPRSGLVNFYRGFSPTLLGMLPYAGISFLTHDTANDFLRRPALAPYTTTTTTTKPPTSSSRLQSPSPRSPKLKPWAQLLAGGFAGLVSQTASYPLEIIRRRMQVGGVVGDGHRLRMGETARRIWAERGFRGFWVGLGIGYIKVVPMAAVSFFVYGRAKDMLGV